MCMCRAFRYVKHSPVKCLRPDCATHFTPYISNLSCKKSKEPDNFTCTCRFQLFPVDLKTHDLVNWVTFATRVYFNVGITMPSPYRGAKDGEIIGIIVENKHIRKWTRNNLECLMIKFNHEFSVFNICCGPRSILIASRRALLSTSGRN